MRITESTIILLILCLLIVKNGRSQDSASNKSIGDYVNFLDSPGKLFSKDNISKFSSDSSIKARLSKLFVVQDSGRLSSFLPKIKVPEISVPKKLIQIGGGYIGYYFTYRSGGDSSFIENNVAQHLITASFNATIAQTLPIRVTYFERQSNSAVFRDYRDITVDFDVERYKQIKSRKYLNDYRKANEKLLDPTLIPKIQATDFKLNQYKDILNDPKVISELIHAKETVIRKDFEDTSAYFRDSLVKRSKKFIEMYDSLHLRAKKYEHLKDSLQTVSYDGEKKIKNLQDILNGKKLSEADMEQLAMSYGKKDKNIQKLQNAYGGIKKLSVGRTLPNFSDLTLQNVNVNGIHTEYSKNNIYLAAAGGLVDFRIREFLFTKQKPPTQFVYSLRIGYGQTDRNNIIVTYFGGKKQLFGGNLQTPSSHIQGISLSGQLLITRQLRVFAEVAQSGVPYAQTYNPSSKPVIKLNDESQRAYAGGFYFYLPKSRTVAEGHYQHSGINYQSFNNFQYNATTNSWSLRFEQSFWKRQIALQAAFRKNDFINPLVLQRYDANTVFKNVTLTFRKYNWPVVSIGYLPASQYTAIRDQVYENHYQSFTGTLSHQYRIGIIKGGTLISFSRFFNSSSDTGFVYYNSRNFFITQNFLFRLFNATVTVSGMKNNQNELIVMEEAVSATLFKMVGAGFAIKINNLNKEVTKVGFNAKLRANLKRVGEINLWMEQSFLPAQQGQLFKYEMYSLGLVRYFNYK